MDEGLTYGDCTLGLIILERVKKINKWKVVYNKNILSSVSDLWIYSWEIGDDTVKHKIMASFREQVQFFHNIKY